MSQENVENLPAVLQVSMGAAGFEPATSRV